MNTEQAIRLAGQRLLGLKGYNFDVLEVAKPVSVDAAVNLSRVVSKLSPILGNLIEFNTVEFLNTLTEFQTLGKWIRQDPGFPDTLFQGSISPAPGFEIKAWFPLATEITARFRDSQNHFEHDQTHVAMLAWLPQHLIYGRPYILDVVVVSAKSVAKARDDHYHSPPGYLVLEPEDTTSRTRNLQQTNCAGYKFQGTAAQLAQAEKVVKSWGKSGGVYLPTREYQAMCRELLAKFPYRLDTNFAKMDRIVHGEIEAFKSRVMDSTVHGRTVGEWIRLLARDDEAEIRRELQTRFGIATQPLQAVQPSPGPKPQ